MSLEAQFYDLLGKYEQKSIDGENDVRYERGGYEVTTLRGEPEESILHLQIELIKYGLDLIAFARLDAPEIYAWLNQKLSEYEYFEMQLRLERVKKNRTKVEQIAESKFTQSDEEIQLEFAKLFAKVEE